MLKLLVFSHCSRMMNTVQMATTPVLLSLVIRMKRRKAPKLAIYSTTRASPKV